MQNIEIKIDTLINKVQVVIEHKERFYSNICTTKGQKSNATKTCNYFNDILDYYEGTCCKKKWDFVDKGCGGTVDNRTKYNIPQSASELCEVSDFPKITNLLKDLKGE